MSTNDGVRKAAELLGAEPSRAVAAVDFDGTLAPIVPRPEDARGDAAAVAALGRLGERIGTVAVVTGRPAELAVEYGGFAEVPGLERMVVLGHYGAERWDAAAGRVEPVGEAVPAGRLAELRAGLERLTADREQAPEGVRLEDKGRALAVHVRETDDPVRALALLDGPVRALAREVGMVVEPGRMVLEVRPAGVDKGAALASLCGAAGTPVLYAGDDLGDVPAFREVRRRGGFLVYVAAETGEAPVKALAAMADVIVDGVPGLAEFLSAVADQLA
ncbi:trehalose-phosphatase [Mangrovactinospora gilvigrisea]|uniref:trehalose-phosphatase n=1 Tax=Mangrovactinospora gilvigrisea TaxID=1428644 RepID=UPI001FECCE65|nr:trehalose-phosphatase [Mangrovactinospora gilvigrisea]